MYFRLSLLFCAGMLGGFGGYSLYVGQPAGAVVAAVWIIPLAALVAVTAYGDKRYPLKR